MDKRIALVTGASRGIGAAIATVLAQDGFDLWLNYRSNHEAAERVKNEIEETSAQCRLLPFDVSDAEATLSALDPLIEKETPYILVNNAGFTRDMLMIWMN